MPDIATLAIKVENTDVIKATASLDSMTVAGTKSEAAAQRLTRRMALLEIEARNMDSALGKTESRALSLGKAWIAAGAAIAAGFVFHELIKNTIEAQNAMAQLEAAVKSTAGVAGRSVQQLDDFSMALQQTTTYSDEAVKGAQAMLLTFDRIRGVQFDQATQAVADLAARMGGDLQSAAVQVGKALQDPETGLTALRRSGVSFTASQIEMIKKMYETNRVAEGQAIILKELEHQFGGSAAAARNTLGGAITHLKNVFGDLFEVSKGGSASVVAAINAMADALPKAGEAMKQFITNTIVGYNNIAAAISKGANWVKAFVDLSHGNGGTLAIIGSLNQAVEDERLGANALAVTTAAATVAQVAHTKATYEAADAAKKAAEAAKELEKARERASRLAHANLEVDISNQIAASQKKQADAAKLLETNLAGVAAQYERIRATFANHEAEDAAAKALADAQQKYVDDMQAIWLNGANRIADGFVQSMRRGFEEVYNLAVQLMKRMEEAKKTSGSGYTALGYGSIGLGSGLAGYGVGSASASGNRGSSALFGAAAGAASGAMAGSVIPGIGTAIGAAVGAVAGFVGGIIGAGHAADLSAHEMENLRKSLATSIADVRAQLSGDALGSAVLQLHAQFDALRKAAEDAYAYGENEAQRKVVLAQLNDLEAQRVAQLKAEFALMQTQAQEDYRIRTLIAQGRAQEADDLAFAEKQQREYAAAVKASADAATLAALAEAQAAEASQRTLDLAAQAKKAADDAALEAAEALRQAAEAAAAAAQKALDQQRALEDLNVEILRAKGQGGAADDLQFQLEQQRRLDDAKKNQSDDFVQKLLELQQLQRDSRAAQGLIDSTTGPSSGYGSGASAAQMAVSATVTERTSLMIVDLLRAIEVNTRGGAGGSNAPRLTFNIRKEITQENLEEIIDEVRERLLDFTNEGLGTRSVQTTLRSGSVRRN